MLQHDFQLVPLFVGGPEVTMCVSCHADVSWYYSPCEAGDEEASNDEQE